MKLPSLDTVPIPSRNPRGSRVSLGVMENLVLTLMDGRNSICDIGDACGLETEMAQRIFKRLYQLRVVDLPGFHDTASVPVATGPTAAAATPTAPQATASSPANANDRREQLEETVGRFYAKLDQLNFYEVLGVPVDADRKTIRTAYFALSKQFHPDKAFGRDIEKTRSQMTRIFHVLTRAFETLSNAKQRQAYDASLHRTPTPAPTPAVPAASTAPAAPTAPARAAAVTRVQPKAVPMTSPTASGIVPRPPIGRPKVKPAPASKAPASPVPRTTPVPTPRRTSASPHAATRNHQSMPSPRRSSMPPNPTLDETEIEARREQWKRERLQRSLAGLQPNARTAQMRSVEAMIAHARIALERFECDEALRTLETILAAHPNHPEAQKLMTHAMSRQSKSCAAEFIKEGRLLQTRGLMGEAMRQFEKALSVDQENLEARYFIASLLLELDQNLSRALALTREIISGTAPKAKYYALFGDLMIKENSLLRAAEAYQKALQMDPRNPDYKKRLKSLQRA
ncbi:MAG: DnaJ domain-containing protein [Proteobacteria bacterium]|nr:DnaJ domain-containing protein [Pseudomonadota bacterium]